MSQTIKLQFNLENNILPQEMERVLVSFIKSSVEKVSQKKYEEWYLQKNIQKSFCWSTYYPGVKSHNGVKELSQNWFAMNISTPNAKDFITLFNAFIKRKNEPIKIKNNTMTIKSVNLEILPDIDATHIIVQTESPVIVRGKDKLFLTDADQDFSATLETSINSLLYKFGRESTVRITPKLTASVATTAFGPVIGNTGFFELNGDKEDLEFLLSSGIGSRRSEGFGRIKVVKTC